jgi:hypothetical protein
MSSYQLQEKITNSILFNCSAGFNNIALKGNLAAETYKYEKPFPASPSM